MKSAEVYRIVQDVLGPACAEAGFTATRKPACCWCRAQNCGHVVLWMSVSSKYAWSPASGGQLFFRAMFCDQPAPCWEAGQWRFHFLQTFLDEDGIRAMAALRRQVIDKLIHREFDTEVDRMLHTMVVDLLRLSRDSAILRNQDQHLPYLDAEDVSAWAQFVCDRLQQIAEQTLTWPAGAHVDEWHTP